MAEEPSGLCPSFTGEDAVDSLLTGEMSLLLCGFPAAGLEGDGDLTGICQEGILGADGEGGNCLLRGGRREQVVTASCGSRPTALIPTAPDSTPPPPAGDSNELCQPPPLPPTLSSQKRGLWEVGAAETQAACRAPCPLRAPQASPSQLLDSPSGGLPCAGAPPAPVLALSTYHTGEGQARVGSQRTGTPEDLGLTLPCSQFCRGGARAAPALRPPAQKGGSGALP